MNKPIEGILLPKPELRPRIYAYSIADKAHVGYGITAKEIAFIEKVVRPLEVNGNSDDE